MKKKLFLSPLIILIIIIVAGVSLAGASLLIGNSGDNSPATAIDLQRGLVGWWKMDGNANDSSPYRNNGTVSGATLVNDRKYQALKAYSFNGTSNYIGLGTLTLPNVSISVSAWVKGNQDQTVGDWSYIVAQTAFEVEFGIYSNSGNLIMKDSGATGTPTASGSMNITDGQWHHVVGTINSEADTINTYIDGVFIDSSPYSGGSAKTGTFNIGGTATNRWWKGQIDDVRIYNRALTSTEITALYDSYNPGVQISDLQKGLVGHWKMDGNANDFSSYRNNGTVTGASLTTDRKGQVNKAYSFNGTSSRIQSTTPSGINGGTTLAISFWIKPDSSFLSDFRDSFSFGDSKFRFENTTSTQDDFSIYNPGIDSATITCNNCWIVDAWNHTLFKSDGTNWSLYVNNVVKASGTVDSTLTGSGTVTLGSRDGSTAFWKGSIDDVRIYNRALTSAEITALYDSYNPGVQISNLQKGLVGHWKMDGNANDFSAYRNNGTVTGATLTTDRKGQISKAYEFNEGDYIDIGGSESTYDFGSNPFTIAAWVYLDAFDTNSRHIVSKYEIADGERSWAFSVRTDGGIGLSISEIGLGSGTTTSYTAAGTVTTGQWYHVAVVKSGTTATFYVNGSSKANMGDNPYASVNNSSTPLFMGGLYNANIFYDGKIDDVRIYNRALTSTEVADLYNSY